MAELRRLRATVRIEAVDEEGKATLLTGKSGLSSERVDLEEGVSGARALRTILDDTLREVIGDAIDAAVDELAEMASTHVRAS